MKAMAGTFLKANALHDSKSFIPIYKPTAKSRWHPSKQWMLDQPGCVMRLCSVSDLQHMSPDTSDRNLL